jgi:ribonuclease P protein component
MGKLALLKTEQDFSNFRQSKSFQSRLLKIRVHYSLNQNNPRFGFIIPKKVLPKVVDRNKLKRRIKFVLSAEVSRVQPADVLIFPHKDLLKLKFADLTAEVRQLFTQAKLWKR